MLCAPLATVSRTTSTGFADAPLPDELRGLDRRRLACGRRADEVACLLGAFRLPDPDRVALAFPAFAFVAFGFVAFDAEVPLAMRVSSSVSLWKRAYPRDRAATLAEG
jgi:hypothetical protein